MESLSSLATLMAAIRKLSREILEEGMSLLDQKEDIVEGMLDARPEADADHAEVALQEAVVEMLKDAEDTDRDLIPFARAITAVERTSSDELDANCPFLAAVWYGDAYDVTGVDALKALQDELQAQYDKMTVEEVTKAAEKLLDKLGKPAPT